MFETSNMNWPWELRLLVDQVRSESEDSKGEPPPRLSIGTKQPGDVPPHTAEQTLQILREREVLRVHSTHPAPRESIHIPLFLEHSATC